MVDIRGTDDVDGGEVVVEALSVARLSSETCSCCLVLGCVVDKDSEDSDRIFAVKALVGCWASSSSPTTEPAYEVADSRKRVRMSRESTGTPVSTLVRRVSRSRKSCISSIMHRVLFPISSMPWLMCFVMRLA